MYFIVQPCPFPFLSAAGSSLHNKYSFKAYTAGLDMWTGGGAASVLLYNSMLSLWLWDTNQLGVCLPPYSSKFWPRGIVGAARVCWRGQGAALPFHRFFCVGWHRTLCWTRQGLGGRRGKVVFGLFDIPRKSVPESLHYSLWRHISDTKLQC